MTADDDTSTLRLEGAVAVDGALVGVIRPDADDVGYDLTYELDARLAIDEMPARLRLTALVLPVRSWRDLDGLVVTFQTPALQDGRPVRWEGLGEVTVGGRHHPIVARRVTFAAAGSADTESGPRYEATLDADVQSPPSEAGAPHERPFQLIVPFVLGPVAVRLAPGSTDGATDVAAQFLCLDDYEFDDGDGDLELRPHLS